MPRLSAEAISILQSNPDPHQAFRDEYGEYYVGAYILGGANASMVSGSAASSSNSKDISGQYTVKAVLYSKTKAIEEHERGSSSVGNISLAAFDSLDAWQANSNGSNGTSYTEIKRSAESNKERGWALAERVTRKARDMRIESGSEVSWDTCDAICKAGLVADLLLLPYAGLRDYAAAILSARNK